MPDKTRGGARTLHPVREFPSARDRRSTWQPGGVNIGAMERSWRLQIGLLLAVSLFIAAAIALSWTAGSDGWERVTSVENLSADEPFYDQEHQVFLIRASDGVLALYARGPWRDEKVDFCRTSGFFEAPLTGSMFDRHGIYYGGPAPRGMSRVPVRVEDGSVLIRPYDRLDGPPRKGPTPLEPEGPLCLY